MTNRITCLLAGMLLLSTSTSSCFADVQYKETTKMTGGAAAGAMKIAGVFSKEARQASKGIEATISVKRNKMRHEDSTGEVTIYDLDARKIITLDTKRKTYAVMTFDEMRAQVEEARKKAAADRAKHKGKSKDEPQQVKIVPKITVTPGKASKKLLNYTANEIKTRIDMEMEAQDSSGQSQSGDMWVSADSFVAPVKAYDEVKRFYVRLAKELNWLPGEVLGGNSNVQIQQPMVEYRKSVTNLNGMPLQSMVSVGMGTMQAGAPPAGNSPNPISKGLGGMFGKKKKHDDADQAPAGVAGSLMDMQTDVTSISTDSLDTSLFQIPAGFMQETSKERKSK